jgi:hypothetical protein
MANLAEIRKAFPAVVLILAVLFSTIIGTQIVRLAEANPNWIWPEVSSPTINISSPVENQIYPSSDVWLRFNVTRPADWLYISSLNDGSEVYLSQGQINFVIYSVDGIVDGIPDEHESEKIGVNDPLNNVNPPSSFSFSFNLKGLQDGQHTVEVYTEGYVNGTGVGVNSQTIHFTVYTPEPLPTTLVVAFVVLVAVIGIGLLVYFKKRKR